MVGVGDGGKVGVPVSPQDCGSSAAATPPMSSLIATAPAPRLRLSHAIATISPCFDIYMPSSNVIALVATAFVVKARHVPAAHTAHEWFTQCASAPHGWGISTIGGNAPI